MQHRLSVSNARCEAADGPSPLQAGKQEHLQKEQTGRVLRSRHECQAKDVRKGGRQAMNSDGKRQGIGWTSVTGEALIPRETPMRTLSSGWSRLPVCCLVSSAVEAYRKVAGWFVNEATGTSDAGWNSVANHPKELGKERVR